MKISRGFWTAALMAISIGMGDSACAQAANGVLPEQVQYIDLTGHFARLAEETAGKDDATRLALFHERMDTVLPGFYVPRFGIAPAAYDGLIIGALKGFDDQRVAYERVQREFPAAFHAGIQHFRKVFPGFTLDVPVYLLHSLGEMDGGTRDIGGKVSLVFGADVIARVHGPHDLTPFLDHELFHVEHGKHFPGCPHLWCSLWSEGLATYAAKVMNPGADDRQLLLTSPKPIRAAVDASWPAAACFTRARLYSKDSADIQAMFGGSAGAKEFPERFGYYVGLRVIEEIGDRPLSELSRMPPERALATLTTAINRLIQKAGGCK